MLELKARTTLFLKGMAMGAADVVPGVSGGTIAFISGIYEELLSSISSVSFNTLRILKNQGIAAAWKSINGNFLLVLISGIFLSIVCFSYLIKYLLEYHTVLIWSFFFGLIVASVWLVGKQIKNRTYWLNILGLLVGTAIAYYITIASPGASELTLPFVFLCGSIAIMAMILPGISGSFILVLLGAYEGILGSISLLIDGIRSGDWAGALASGSILFVFALGCIVGLISFSKVLTWMFKKAHDLTISVLTGFLIGSLNKVWPWKMVDEWFVKHAGTPEETRVPLKEHNVWPDTWELANALPSQWIFALLLAFAGFMLILIFDRFSPESSKE